MYPFVAITSLFSHTSWGGQLTRVPASRSRRSRNPKIVGSSVEPAALKPGRVKRMTLKLIAVAS